MMIIMKANATSEEIDDVISVVKSKNLRVHKSIGDERTIIGAIGDSRSVDKNLFLLLPGVDRIVPISKPYKLASSEVQPTPSIFPINGINIGGNELVIIAGPCSVENRTQLLETAHAVKEAGAHALRGGAFKPRTSPYSFQGLGLEGLKILAEAREQTGLPVVTEVMSEEKVQMVSDYADILQIGARNMQNYALLKEVGRSGKPVLLKRSMSATIEDLLMSAEYILSCGNPRVILCERGIRTFENSTRNTTDINAIPVLKWQTHLPVVLDPSHSTGHWGYVTAIARAGIAAGADGLIVEVHINPSEALSDGGQSLRPERFAEMVEQVHCLAESLGRCVQSYGAKEYASS